MVQGPAVTGWSKREPTKSKELLERVFLATATIPRTVSQHKLLRYQDSHGTATFDDTSNRTSTELWIPNHDRATNANWHDHWIRLPERCTALPSFVLLHSART